MAAPTWSCVLATCATGFRSLLLVDGHVDRPRVAVGVGKLELAQTVPQRLNFFDDVRLQAAGAQPLVQSIDVIDREVQTDPVPSCLAALQVIGYVLPEQPYANVVARQAVPLGAFIIDDAFVVFRKAEYAVKLP